MNCEINYGSIFSKEKSLRICLCRTSPMLAQVHLYAPVGLFSNCSGEGSFVYIVSVSPKRVHRRTFDTLWCLCLDSRATTEHLVLLALPVKDADDSNCMLLICLINNPWSVESVWWVTSINWSNTTFLYHSTTLQQQNNLSWCKFLLVLVC
jgi:hypothetical protein